MSNLNPDQFFHGTTSPIKDGMVRPANDVDKYPSDHSMGDPGDMSEGDHAFVTEDEWHAWNIARTVRPEKQMRPRVYVTGDAPDKKPGPWNMYHPDFLAHHDVHDENYENVPHEIHSEDIDDAIAKHQPEWGSKIGFPVRERIDIMPGYQGTFPQINWTRFSKVDRTTANHPTNVQARFGTNVTAQPTSDPERHGKSEQSVHEEALREHAERENPEPKRRTGSRLRAFMAGQPDPGPLADHPRLF